MKYFLLLLTFVGSAFAQPAMICHVPYALCAASPTTPTGKTIVINGITFQEGVSVCPVLSGVSVGSPNLQAGSCKHPGKDMVWSMFTFKTTYPQAPSWAVVKAVDREFVTTAGTGGMANQWGYPCKVRPQKVNGATLADCLGPLNESPWNSSVVPIGTSVMTAAPVGSAYAVGGPAPK